MRTIPLLAACCICLMSTFCIAQTTQSDDWIENMGKIPDPAAGHRWQDDAKAEHWPQAAIDAIGRDKILFGHAEFKQIFDPYVSSGYPLFVTSDSLLNAYHVLFEESVRQMESANVRKLRGILHDLWEPLARIDGNVVGDPAMAAAAKLRAQMTIAVALTLLGDDTMKLDATLSPMVAAEVKKVREATAVEKPGWLGPPDDDFVALDYARFAPRGFYTQSERLQNYFRAVAWLEAIPFRVNDDLALLSAAMIGSAANAVGERDIDELTDFYSSLLGDPDNPGLKILRNTCAAKLWLNLRTPDDLAKLRQSILEETKDFQRAPEINDQLRLPPRDKASLTFRILPARRTPDAVLFQRLMEKSGRSFPSGLDVAADLGSAYARQSLPANQSPGDPLFDPKNVGRQSVYCDYLYCLQALLAAPEKDAPAIFSSAPWKMKSCQTALAGWAQLRHTWQLQAKENVEYLGVTIRPAGFVEPVPEFYSRMAALCDRVGWIVQQGGEADPDFAQLSADAHELIALARKTDVGPDGKSKPHELTLDEQMRFQFMLFAASLASTEPRMIGDLQGALSALKTLAADFDKGNLPDNPEAAKLIKQGGGPDLNELWNRLETISRRLDALANKQLRGAEFNEDENRFLKHYGADIAGVMLYGGNSYEVPRDDAPRIADVYQNPKVNQFLEVGIGRPRAIYVLYPYHGGEVLCEGAVMPYYEFAAPKPLTDGAWKSMLDGKTPPASFFPAAHP